MDQGEECICCECVGSYVPKVQILVWFLHRYHTIVPHSHTHRAHDYLGPFMVLSCGTNNLSKTGENIKTYLRVVNRLPTACLPADTLSVYRTRLSHLWHSRCIRGTTGRYMWMETNSFHRELHQLKNKHFFHTLRCSTDIFADVFMNNVFRLVLIIINIP